MIRCSCLKNAHWMVWFHKRVIDYPKTRCRSFNDIYSSPFNREIGFLVDFLWDGSSCWKPELRCQVSESERQRKETRGLWERWWSVWRIAKENGGKKFWQIWGRGFSAVVKHWPRDQTVAGSNPAGRWAFSSTSSSFLSFLNFQRNES